MSDFYPLKSLANKIIVLFLICMLSMASPKTKADDATEVYKKVSGSVVLVQVETHQGKKSGSGVVYSNGYNMQFEADSSLIVSNAHVIKGATSIFILKDSHNYSAKVLYSDKDIDLALLRVNSLVLAPASQNKNIEIDIGAKVYAIGSPLGLENSISDGIVSSKRKKDGINLIQTTAPISHGNSGGGLFDENGTLIGITTYKIAGGENLSFAVDARYVEYIADAHIAAKLIIDFANMYEHRTADEYKFTKWILRRRLKYGENIFKKCMDSLKIFANVDATNEVKVSAASELIALLDDFLVNHDKNMPENPGTLESKIVLLTCEMKDNNDINLRIDFEHQKVNQSPAKLTDSEI